MTRDPSKPMRGWTGVLTSLALGYCVFYLGRTVAVWLTIHNVHGFSAFLDNVAAGAAASLVVLIYERRRQQAERALLKSEETFSKAFRQSPMSLTITSTKDHHYIDVNETYERITGWSREEIIGRTPLDIGLYVEPAQRAELVNRALTQGGFRNQEVHFRMRDGSIRVALMSGELITLGGKTCLLNVGADITAYKQVEEALKKSEEKFSKAFRESPIAITLTSTKDHRYIDVNETFEHITGYSREEALGRTALDLGLWVDPSQRLELVRRLLAEGSIRDLEVAFRSKDGSIRVGLGSAELIEIDGEQLVLSTVIDITERQQAERALRESEGKFRTIFRSAPTGMVMISPEGRFLAANEAFCKFLGYSEAELLSRDILPVTPPEAHALSLQAMIPAIDDESGLQRFEKRYFDKDGRLKWGEVNASLIRDSDGKPQFFVSQVVDITERKRAEEALRKSEERYRHLVESSNDWVWEVDAEGVYTYAGPQCRKILGYEPAEIVGRTPFDLMPPEESRRVAAAFNAIATERKAFRQLENINLHKDGHLVVLETNGVPVIDEGGFRGYRGMDRDVTERRQAEEALRESEERFRRVVEHIGDALIVDDVDGRVVFANDRFLNLFGFRREELQNVTLEDYIAPEYRAQLRDRHNRRMRGETVPSHFEYEGVRRSDGRRMWLEVDVVPLRDQTGKLVGTQSALRDITERKRVEDALRQRQAELKEAQRLAQLGSWLWDLRSNVITWSEQLNRIHGYDPSLPPPSSEALSQLFTQESWDRLSAALKKARLTGVVDDMDLELVRPDGSRRWIATVGEAVRDAHGLIVQLRGTVQDITERKRAEESLREYEHAIEGAEEMITVLDREYRYVIANRAFLNYRKMTGEQVLGRCISEVLDRQVFENVKEKIDECFTGKVVRYEMKYTYPDIGERDLFVSYFPIEGPAGSDRLICILQDITERKRVEQELLRSASELKEAQRVAQLGNWQWDPNTNEVIWSEQLSHILGYDPKFPAPSFRDQARLLSPESWELLARTVESTLQTGAPYELDLEVIRPDGARAWITGRGEAVRDRDGRIVLLRGTALDITERKRAEQALRESEERFRFVANAAPVMIWMSGPDKLCTYFNQPWLEFTGQPLEAQLGNGWAQGVHPDDLPQCLDTYTQSFDFRAPFRMEYRLRRHDGEYRWIEDTGVPLTAPDGAFAGYIGSCVDITDRKKAEEALRGVSRKLIEAEEKERRRIARELHDDINQRLAMLAIEIQQLKDIPLRSVARLRERTGKLFKLTTEISADIQLMSHRLHSSSLEYLGLVPAMRGFCAEYAKYHGVEVDFTHSHVPAALPPDVALSLFRVLQEALHNAMKHSGVRKFEAQLRGTSKGILLTVRDFGKGFNPEAAASGQGLGLVSMRERVNLLKGTISIVSKPKFGTEITVRVPLVEEAGASQHASA